MKIRINKIIQVLILSDIALIAGYGLYTPIFAIFIADKIEGGNVEVAGFASAVYWVVYSLAIIPFAHFLDKNHGEKDDFWFIVIGNFLASLAIFGYVFATSPGHVYLLQIIYAIGLAMNMPAYTAIFTRHIDKGKEAFDWAVRGALIGLATGLAGALGGFLANRIGFIPVFVGVSIFLLLSAILPFLIFKDIIPQKEKGHLPLIGKGP